jgi:hypothetical protein
LQELILVEKTELDNRLEKLAAFMKTPEHAAISEAEKHRIRSQRYFMQGYSHVLLERIDAFEG